jgi:hypothetical protein
VLLFAISTFAQLSFTPIEEENTQAYSSPNGPTDLFVADLNGDGKPDVVTTQSTSNAVTVFLNQGGGVFLDGGSAQYLTGQNPQRVVVADFNGDGKLDIATANCDSITHVGSVSLLLGNGDGTFQNHNDVPLAGCPNSLGIIHANSDALPDLVVAEDVTNDIQLLLNSGGTFVSGTRIVAAAGQTFRGVSAADYNRDGKDDIAVIQAPLAGGSSSVVLYLAGGTSFTPRAIFQVAGDALAANTVDAKGDGIADLLVPFTDANGGHVEVLMNNNNAALWTTETLSGLGGVGWKALAKDFDGNGFAEVVAPAINDPNIDNDGYVAYGGTSKASWGFPILAIVGAFAQSVKPQAAAAGNFAGTTPGVAGVNLATNQLQVFPQPLDASSGCLSDDGSTNICSPTAGAVVTSPFHVSTDAEPRTVSPDANVTPREVASIIYLDGKQVFESHGNGDEVPIETDLTAGVGTHTLTVNSWDQTGFLSQFKATFTVGAVSAGQTVCTVPAAAGVKICSPASASSVASPLAISAAANGGTKPITAMKAYLDGKQVAASTSAKLTASVAAAAGTHTVIVNAWNSAGTLFQGKVTLTVK